MRKKILVLACIGALMLAGCQKQFDPSNAGSNLNQTTSDSTTDPVRPTESDPANTDTDLSQTDGRDDPSADTSSVDEPTNTPTLPDEIGGNVNSVETGNDDLGWVTVTSTTGNRELKSEGSLRGEIEVTHKLTCGTMTLDEGDTVLFSLDTSFSGAELKITLTGAQTGTILEGYVTGSGEESLFETDTADEYSVVIENCGRSAVQFTIDYSIGGSK